MVLSKWVGVVLVSTMALQFSEAGAADRMFLGNGQRPRLAASADPAIAQNSIGSSAMVQSIAGQFASAPSSKSAKVQARVLNAGLAARVVLDPVSAESLYKEMAKAQAGKDVPFKVDFSRNLLTLRTFAQLVDLATVSPPENPDKQSSPRCPTGEVIFRITLLAWISSML